MLLFDGIVFTLQETGGISVLFSEIISRMPAASYELIGFRKTPPTAIVGATYSYYRPRPFERYRRARTTRAFQVFHSTYYRLPKSTRPKVVTTVYDFVYERFAPVHRRVVHTLQKQHAIAGSDRIICISENTRRDLLEFSGPSVADRTVVIPLAASDSFHPLSGEAVLPQVLFVGKRAGYKNFAAVVEALATLSDFTLLCVGGGPFDSAELDLLERRIPKRHRFAGTLSTSDATVSWSGSDAASGIERYEALTNLTGDIPDLLAEAGIAELPADGVANRASDPTEHIAEEALRSELRTGVERQHACELTGDPAGGLSGALVAEGSADQATDRGRDRTEQIAEEALWDELSAGIVLHELRTGLERQEASELTGHAADLLAEALIAECSADGAAKRRADLAEQIAEEALRRELLACQHAVRRKCLQSSVQRLIHVSSSLVAVEHTSVAMPRATNGADRKACGP